jgi:hypothetical protein
VIKQKIRLWLNFTYVKWLVIPSLLLMLWMFFSIGHLLMADFSFSILSFNHNQENQNLNKGLNSSHKNVWHGEFKAKEDYLGIISIEFKKSETPVQDFVIFRIKEKGNSKWFEENTYDSRQFYFFNKFPLGFKVIPDSKNKIYEFEFESISKNTHQSINFQKLNPVVVSKYQFPKELLLTNPKILISFLFKKINYGISIPEFTKNSILYLVPLLVYLNIVSLGKIYFFKANWFKKIINSQFLTAYFQQLDLLLNLPTILFLALLSFLISVTDYSSLYLNLFLILVWITLIFIKKYPASINFFLILHLFLPLPLALYLDLNLIISGLNNWIYYLLLIGVVHALIKNNEK